MRRRKKENDNLCNDFLEFQKEKKKKIYKYIIDK